MINILLFISVVFAAHIPVEGAPNITNTPINVFTNSTGILDMSGLPNATGNFTIDNLNMDLNQCAVDIINKYGLHNDV